MTNFWEKRQYSEESSEPDDLAKRGKVLLISEFFTISANTTIAFAMTTGSVDIQFAFYDIDSDATIVKGELVENPTSFSATPSTIVARNLNRNYPDTTTVTIQNASSISGGTVIARELVGTGHKAGGGVSSVKIHTLKKNEDYIMRFENTENQSTTVHLNLAWVEDPIVPASLVTAA